MPIKELSEIRRLDRLGKIHLGVQKESKSGGTYYPSATSHFVVPDEVAKVYGQEPTELDIIFPVENPEVFASQFYRAYTKTRGLGCRGTGSTAARLIDIRTKKAEKDTGVVTGDIAGSNAQEVEWVSGVTCPGRECGYYKRGQCKQLMNLQFMLPKVPGLGVWQLDTTSYHSIVNINSMVDVVREIFGRVAGVPLVLSVEPQEVTPGGQRKTVYVLHLRSREKLDLLAKAARVRASPELPQSDDEVPDLLYPTQEQLYARARDSAV